MAKVIYSSLVAGIAGKVEDIVYYRSHNNYFGYIRSYIYPRITGHNIRFGEKVKAIGKFWGETSPGFRDEIEKYTNLYRNLPPDLQDLKEKANSPTALFIKIMFNFEDRHKEHVDLVSITPDDIIDLYPEIMSMRAIIANGYIPKLGEWENMESPTFPEMGGN